MTFGSIGYNSQIYELKYKPKKDEKHGPLGTAPAELVRLVLEQKDKEIRMLKAGMVEIERT